MKLFATEIRRGLARRSTRVLLAIAVLAIACAGVGVFLTHEAGFDPEAAQAGATGSFAENLQACIDAGGLGDAGGATGNELRAACLQFAGSPADYVEDNRFELRKLSTPDGEGDGDSGGVFVDVAFFLVVGALIGGATYIGGDWRHGTVGTLLTWEPRRVRVYAAKVAAASVITFVVGLCLYALLTLALLPSAIWRGTTDGVDSEWVFDAVVAVLRLSAVGVAAALIGFTIACVGRNTSAAIGVAFAYLAVVEGAIRGLKPEWSNWLVGENTTTVVLGRLPTEASFDRELPAATLTLAFYIAVLLIGAGIVFFRRDVT